MAFDILEKENRSTEQRKNTKGWKLQFTKRWKLQFTKWIRNWCGRWGGKFKSWKLLPRIKEYALATGKSTGIVSTVIFQVIFARFCKVEHVSDKSACYLWRYSCSKKVPVEKESSLFMGGAIIFLALFPKNYILCQQYNICGSTFGGLDFIMITCMSSPKPGLFCVIGYLLVRHNSSLKLGLFGVIGYLCVTHS